MIGVMPVDEFPLASEIGAEAFASAEPDWDFLRNKYGEGVYINRGTPLEWKEVVLTLPKFKDELAKMEILSWSTDISFTGSKLDSFTIQAQRRGRFRPQNIIETCLYCFTEDPQDDTLLMGVRAGRELGIGKIVCAPAGAVEWNIKPDKKVVGEKVIDMIGHSVYKEGMEEAGILPSDIEHLLFRGAYCQASSGGSPSNVVLYHSMLNIPGEDIITRHQKAMELYTQVKKEFPGNDLEKEIEARRVLAERAEANPTFPRDAWENSSLRKFSNKPDALIDLFKSGDVELLHGMYGAFALHFINAFPENDHQWYHKLMELKPFKENVQEDFVKIRGYRGFPGGRRD